MPCSRHSSGTGAPPSACLRIDSIWLSEKRDYFMQNLPAFSLRKILLLSTLVFRGDYLPAGPLRERANRRRFRWCHGWGNCIGRLGGLRVSSADFPLAVALDEVKSYETGLVLLLCVTKCDGHTNSFRCQPSHSIICR